MSPKLRLIVPAAIEQVAEAVEVVDVLEVLFLVVVVVVAREVVVGPVAVVVV